MITIKVPSTRFDVSRAAFEKAINEAVKDKFGTLDKRHSEYLDKELALIKTIPDSWIAHLLIASDFVKTMKEKNPYSVSEGRGTIVGSFAAYLLDITGIDPVEFDLSAERFYIMSKTKPSPDIDIDIASSLKKDAEEYLLNTYGNENVVRPIVYNKTTCDTSPHACAYFILPHSYKSVANKEEFPRVTSKCTVVNKTWEELQELGFMRINLIATKFQDDLMDNAKGRTFALVNIDNYGKLMDKKNTTDIAYSALFKDINYSYKKFEDVVFVLAASRRELFYKDLRLGRFFKNDSFKNEFIDELLKDTNGYFLFQEQINDVLCYVLNCDYYTANTIRKDITKKNMKTVRHVFKKFVASLTDMDVNPRAIVRLWEELCDACVYSTLKSHFTSVAYNVVESVYFKTKGE